MKAVTQQLMHREKYISKKSNSVFFNLSNKYINLSELISAHQYKRKISNFRIFPIYENHLNKKIEIFLKI